jgi:hypothetical protein
MSTPLSKEVEIAQAGIAVPSVCLICMDTIYSQLAHSSVAKNSESVTFSPKKALFCIDDISIIMIMTFPNAIDKYTKAQISSWFSK